MAKKEANTDLWVAAQLRECDIPFTAQGSDVKEINEALSTASKRGTGYAGYPEYVAVVNDFVIVIEDKADLGKHQKLTDTALLDTTTKAVTDYAVNGAYFYAKHIAQNSSFKKVFAVGVSGDEKHHKITPLYVDDREDYMELKEIESFTIFNPLNIHEYYLRNVLKEKTDVEKTAEQILKDASTLHEYLRTYGSLKDQDKPLVVSGILLALDEIESGSFSIDSLTGDRIDTDGEKIYNAIQKRLRRSNVGPDAKRDKLMSEFSIIKTSARLNEVDDKLKKTPLKYYAEFLKANVFDNIKYKSSSEDFIGRFYGEFMSYSGGDGQTLGIVLTPAHICELFCDLLNVQPDDIILDPTCGTAGFLVAAMHHMISATNDDIIRRNIRKKQLHGYELQSNMFAIACTNMILRDDGNSNIWCQDFLKQNPAKVQLKGATVGMMNPPYSQGTKDDPSQYELSFVEHLLDSLVSGARAAVIVPQSSMTGKTKAEQAFKESIMKHHTLEGVITCNTDTFYGVGTNPVIAVFTAHEPHQENKVCKFIDFREDGYEVKAHIGLVEGENAKDKKQHLLDVWNGRVEAPSKFCVKAKVKPNDEWLHSFYYFNDEIPAESNFEKTIGDYLSFEFSMVMQNREYLFTGGEPGNIASNAGRAGFRVPSHEPNVLCDSKNEARAGIRAAHLSMKLSDRNWKDFLVPCVFQHIQRGKRLKKADHNAGMVPYVSSTANNNGVDAYIEAAARTRVFANCISLANSGSVGTAFYEPFAFVASDHVTSLKRENANPYVYLFLTTVLEQQKSNFDFNREINDSRIKNMRIMLPVNDKEAPDYQFMEDYMKVLMLTKRKQYQKYINKEQETHG